MTKRYAISLKKIFIILGIVLVLLPVFLFLNNSNNAFISHNTVSSNTSKIIASNKYYDILKNNESEYTYLIYDLDGNVVEEKIVYYPPTINFTDRHLLEIITSAGGGNRQVKYYNLDKNVFSEYFYPVLDSPTYNDLVTFMDYDKKGNLVLVVRDIFDKDNFYKEYNRDFADFIAPWDVVNEISFCSDNEIFIEYFTDVLDDKGNNILKSEIIKYK